MSNDMETVFSKLEKILQKDPGKRGIENLVSNTIKNDLLSSCKQLLQSKSVAIITGLDKKILILGFYCQGIEQETDGPLGTISIAKALKHLGKSVTIVFDEKCSRIMKETI